MNKSALIGGVIVLIIIVILVSVLNNQNPGNNTAAVIESNKSSSMRDLLSISNPQKCEFEDTISDVEIHGVVYVADGKMRSDVESTMQGQHATSHMIILDNILHSWVDAFPSGIKMTFGGTASDEVMGFNPDEKVDFSCEDWSVDESLFVLPSDITFHTVNDFMLQQQPELN